MRILRSLTIIPLVYFELIITFVSGLALDVARLVVILTVVEVSYSKAVVVIEYSVRGFGRLVGATGHLL